MQRSVGPSASKETLRVLQKLSKFALWKSIEEYALYDIPEHLLMITDVNCIMCMSILFPLYTHSQMNSYGQGGRNKRKKEKSKNVL